MNVYAYQATLYCEPCGRAIIDRLEGPQRERDDSGRFARRDYDTVGTDSNHFPAGPYPNGGGEADCPQHCDCGPDCLSPLKLPNGKAVGAWLENPLTADGVAYVQEKLRDASESPVVQFWAEMYREELEAATTPTGASDGDASEE